MSNMINTKGVPGPIVSMIEAQSSQHRRMGDISVTEMIGPAQIRRLRKEHAEEAAEEAADRLFALIGSGVHRFLEDAFKHEGDYLTEILLTARESFIATRGDGSVEVEKTISGTFDLFDVKRGLLYDLKVTSTWVRIDGVKPDWEAQLNVYAWMLGRAGYQVNGLRQLVVFRDWMGSKAQFDRNYPPIAAEEWPVEQWDRFVQREYVRHRLSEHFGPTMPQCTDEERWRRETKFAVVKPGVKRAKRLLPTREEAVAWAEDMSGRWGRLQVEERGGKYVRCASYCPVAGVCPQWKGDGAA